MSIDASDLRIFAEVARESANHVVSQSRASVKKGAVSIKNQLRREAKGSRSFSQVGSTIDFDFEADSSGAEAFIGPNKSVGASAALAGIGYFGTSKPGGATLPDPVKAIEVEVPKLEAALGDILKDVFG